MAFDIPQDNRDLRKAVESLEFPSFIAKLQKKIGMPIELALQRLPIKITKRMGTYTEAALEQAFRVVLVTVDKKAVFRAARNKTHQGLVLGTGAVGGFLGGTTLALELPVSTAIMMRSIAEIARAEGEDLSQVEPRISCLSVLGLGPSRDVMGFGIDTSGYFHVRHLFAAEVRKAMDYVAASALSEEAAPIVAKMLSRIAERFGTQLTEKIAAQLVPVVGAVSGATINYMFITHFQRIARGHFIVRRLERKYGHERVQTEYESIYQRLITDGATQPSLTASSLDEVAVAREFSALDKPLIEK